MMMRPASCAGNVRRGDLVIFRTGAHSEPVIKIVKAEPGDSFGVMDDGIIRVNGTPVLNSTGNSYVLPPSARGVLRAYQCVYQGTVPAETFLLLGDGAKGVIDSARIGLIHSGDFVMVGRYLND